MARLIEFTFDNLIKDAGFVRLVMGENLLGGRYLKKSNVVPALTLPLMEGIKDLLTRGEAAGVFRKDVDPLQLYITILSVGFTHLSNRHTLSAMFRRDLSDPQWLEARRKHVRTVVLSYLQSDSDY